MSTDVQEFFKLLLVVVELGSCDLNNLEAA